MSGHVAVFASLILVATLICAGVVRGAIVYAHRRGMLDQPGQRRSHTTATPRGGGVGIVVACLLVLPVCSRMFLPTWSVPEMIGMELALLLVAAIGWWDDHASLGVKPRLAVQLLAAGGLAALFLAHAGFSWWWWPLLLLAGAWSINLHNFMDGIDGLLAQQMIFVCAGLAMLAGHAALVSLSAACACVAGAAAGFWWFNRMPARIFMGDVGSGAAGLLVFAFTMRLWLSRQDLLWAALVLSSAFVSDASLTLLKRMWAGQRWHSPHRQHLYQWIVRKGHNHASSAAWYLAWNLLVSAPAAWLAAQNPGMGFVICLMVYAVAMALWFVAKGQLTRRKRES